LGKGNFPTFAPLQTKTQKKQMKTSIKVTLAALVLAAFAFDGCKKGPDDPFMSIHTRKGRMTGDWTVKSGNGTSTSGSTTTTWTYDGTTYSETTGSITGTATEAMTWSFEKDGTYKSVTTVTSSGYSDVVTETGTWNFTGKIGDDKNKDHAVMKTLTSTEVETIGSNATTTTTTYVGDDAPVSIMYIDELKNKEMIFTYNGTTTTSSGTSTDSGKWTLAQ
jgi:hypothetical protein